MKIPLLKTHKIHIIPKGLVHGFGQKCEILLVKKLKILDREKVFADVLARKEAFKDCENRKIRIFPKG